MSPPPGAAPAASDVLPPHVAHRAAVDLALGLVSEAFWAGDRCTWVGAEPMEQESPRRGPAAGQATFRALGPDVYGGTAGVALFLAETAALTDEPAIRRTAIGAARHAVAHHGDVDPGVRPGFYVGWAGIGHCLLRVGAVLGATEVSEQGHDILRAVARSLDDAGPDREYDLVAGVSGAVLGLAGGYRATGDEVLLRGAARGAEHLLDRAERGPSGWSWASPNLPTGTNLTGLSHGASGAAVALLEAHRLTADGAFAAGARRAMAYEDSWFDPRAANWPDFRNQPVRRRTRTRSSTLPSLTLWCHGAPGIALARMHAYRCLGEQRWLQDAATAAGTTEKVTREHLRHGMNFSLCHGLAGNAECVGEVAAAVADVDRAFPTEVAAAGVAQFGADTGSWPCGTHSEQTPGLMLGLAGIGHFYLRTAFPDVPSVMLPVG